jgi:hypothetical protein
MLGEKLGTERQWCRVVTQRGLEMSGERGASEDKYRGKKRVYVGQSLEKLWRGRNGNGWQEGIRKVVVEDIQSKCRTRISKLDGNEKIHVWVFANQEVELGSKKIPGK